MGRIRVHSQLLDEWVCSTRPPRPKGDDWDAKISQRSSTLNATLHSLKKEGSEESQPQRQSGHLALESNECSAMIGEYGLASMPLRVRSMTDYLFITRSC